MLSTTFNFQGCFLRGINAPRVTRSSSDFSSVDQCASFCRFDIFMAVVYNTGLASSPLMFCYCGMSNPFTNTAGACNNDRVYVSSHTNSEASRGAQRRKRLAEQQEKERRATQLCPGSLTACLVRPDNKADYEVSRLGNRRCTPMR